MSANKPDPKPDRPIEQPETVPPLAYILAVPYLEKNDAYTGITVPTRDGTGGFTDD